MYSAKFYIMCGILVGDVDKGVDRDEVLGGGGWVFICP